MPKLIKYPIYFFLFFIAVYMITPIEDAYHNELKPIRQGYQTIEYDFLEHYDEKISDDLFMYIHYFITFAENAREFNTVDKANLNNAYLDCIEDNKIFNITCMKNLQSTGEEFLINDKCAWTFFGHTPIVQHKNYYLVNIKEKMCGTFVGRFNSYYVFEYAGNYLKVTNAFLPGSVETKSSLQSIFSIVLVNCTSRSVADIVSLLFEQEISMWLKIGIVCFLSTTPITF